jgi:hypothetical protein
MAMFFRACKPGGDQGKHALSSRAWGLPGRVLQGMQAPEMPGEVSLEVTRVSTPQSWALRAWTPRAWTPKLQAWGCPGKRHLGSRPPHGLPFRLSRAYPRGEERPEAVAPKRFFSL